MNDTEKKFLGRIHKELRNPSVTHSHFQRRSTGGLLKTVINDAPEADRLMKSEDYRKGWEACHERLKEYIEMMMGSTSAQLKEWMKRNET